MSGFTPEAQLDQRKVFLEGTHRARRPEETWLRVEPLMADYGITRVADVTGLDYIGIPVMMAVRPLAETLAVSQGKGATPLLAKLSAAMEAIELWHAENTPLDIVSATAEILDLPYEFGELAVSPNSLLNESSRLSWVEGKQMRSGRSVHVPAELVSLSLVPERGWEPPRFAISSNGLASGNTWEEATLHALYEVIERDALSYLVGRGQDHRVQVAAASVADEHCQRLIDLLRASEVDHEIYMVPSRFAIPCFVAYVWSPEFPIICAGAGSHSSPPVALSRAITEAVQSRLTVISGTRDDISTNETFSMYRNSPGFSEQGALIWSDLDFDAHEFTYVDEELRWAIDRVTSVGLPEPVVVDLSSREELSVVRVVAPGLDDRESRVPW